MVSFLLTLVDLVSDNGIASESHNVKPTSGRSDNINRDVKKGEANTSPLTPFQTHKHKSTDIV